VLRAQVDDKYIFEVPENFDTDLASIPRWFWSILSPQYSAFVYPAILHDYLYHCPGNLPRAFADDVFFSALITEGVSQFTASKMYMAVRLFGQHNYHKGDYCLDKYAFSDHKFIYGYS
jgi:hypothetical protein